jgi:AhpC/TSA family
VELYALQEIVTPLRALGASLVAVSPQLPEHSLSIIQKNQLSFDILRDAGNAYTAELGLRFALPAPLQPIYRSFGIDLPACNGDPAWTLPMPARLVIDREGGRCGSGLHRASGAGKNAGRREEAQRLAPNFIGEPHIGAWPSGRAPVFPDQSRYSSPPAMAIVNLRYKPRAIAKHLRALSAALTVFS